jgi:hypothetical protein
LLIWSQIPVTTDESGHYYDRYDGCECDLLPNNVPEKITFESKVSIATQQGLGWAAIVHPLLAPLINKNVRVTVECLEE